MTTICVYSWILFTYYGLAMWCLYQQEEHQGMGHRQQQSRSSPASQHIPLHNQGLVDQSLICPNGAASSVHRRVLALPLQQKPQASSGGVAPKGVRTLPVASPPLCFRCS